MGGRVIATICAAAFVAGCGGSGGSDEGAKNGVAATTSPAATEPAVTRAHPQAITDAEDVFDQPPRRRKLGPEIAELRKAGFFANEQSPADLAREYDDKYGKYEHESGEPPRLETRADELLLASLDRDRVWFDHLEADALEGNDVYVDLFNDLAKISDGAFAPMNVHEEWQGEDGPVTISWSQGGANHTAEAAALDGWIDPCVALDGVNPTLAKSGRRFALYRAFDKDAYIVAVTKSERNRLEHDFGWVFATDKNAREAYEIGRTSERRAPLGC